MAALWATRPWPTAYTSNGHWSAMQVQAFLGPLFQLEQQSAAQIDSRLLVRSLERSGDVPR